MVVTRSNGDGVAEGRGDEPEAGSEERASARELTDYMRGQVRKLDPRVARLGAQTSLASPLYEEERGGAESGFAGVEL